MPLSPPAPRERLHTRRIVIDGFRREDGLFDIEARLTDTKSYGFPTLEREWIDAGEPLHGMSMRMTVNEDLLIVGFEAVTDYSPYGICPSAAENFSRLVGIQIGRGFVRAAAERVGGTHGCTHLRELLQQMATVAFQTLYAKREKKEAAPGRPPLLDSCYAYSSDSPIVARQWPAYYTGPVEAVVA